MLIEITEEIKHTWRRRRHDYSAGGVAYRRTGGELEIALIATRSGTRWQLPKGTCESGETSEQTALREVAEEVGLLTTCECFLQAIEYWYWDTYRKDTPELVHKRVDFFLLRVIGGELNDNSIEVDGTAWFRPHEALNVLTFLGERDVVQAAMARLRS
jgi:8-oxo-dGTP pyrophosphatase MutT (NUDIX family)